MDYLASGNLGRVISTILAVPGLACAQRIPRQIAPSTAAIQGIVRNPRGLGLGGVEVRLRHPGVADRVASTTGDGAFRFVNLPPGTYDLHAVLD